jgi:hypothetical protein
MVSQGHSAEVAAQTLACRAARYGDALVQQFIAHIGNAAGNNRVIELPLRSVRPGMTILQDVRTEQGMLLVARGFEVTERFTERVKNFGAGVLAMRVAVQFPRTLAKAEDADEVPPPRRER